MAGKWHDINSPGFIKAAKSQKNTQQAEQEEIETVQEEEEPEVELGKPELVEPEDGFEFNKPCNVRVNVKFLKETIKKRIHFKVNAFYNEIEECTAKQVYGFPDENGVALGEVKKLFAHDDYLRDDQKPSDARFYYEVQAWHCTSREPVKSDKYFFPISNGVTTITFKDEDENVMSGVKITLSDGSVLTSDENGRIECPVPENASSFDITKIELAEATT